MRPCYPLVHLTTASMQLNQAGHHSKTLFAKDTENILYALRDCNRISSVWLRLVDPSYWNDFFSWDHDQWLIRYLTQDIGRVRNKSWSLLFRIALDTSQFARNKKVFGEQGGDQYLFLMIQTWVRKCRHAFGLDVDAKTVFHGISITRVH